MRLYDLATYQKLFERIRIAKSLGNVTCLLTSIEDDYNGINRGDRVRGSFEIVVADPRNAEDDPPELKKPLLHATTYELLAYATSGEWGGETIVAGGTILLAPTYTSWMGAGLLPALACIESRDGERCVGVVHLRDLDQASNMLCVNPA